MAWGEPIVTTTNDVEERVPLTDAAFRWAGEERPVQNLIEELIQQELHRDAIVLLAYALPSRLAVWWGALCAWHAAAGAPNDEEAEAFDCVVQWVTQPTESNQRRAHAAAGQLGIETPIGCCAKAAHWAGSLSAENELEPINARGAAKLVAAAALSSVGQHGQSNSTATQQEVLVIGLSVARHETLWSTDPR